MQSTKLASASLANRGDRQVMVNFVIDRKGAVRVPVVTAAEPRELALAVVQMMRNWRFSAPLQHGQPVAVEVTKSLVLSQK
jgi:TonB family protein